MSGLILELGHFSGREQLGCPVEHRLPPFGDRSQEGAAGQDGAAQAKRRGKRR